MSGSELQQAIFEAELDAKRLKNAEISTAKEEGIQEGIKKGEIKSRIEDVINLVSATKMPIEDAIKILKVESKYKKQIEKKLKKLGL